MNKLVKIIKRTGVMTVETGLQINGPGVEIGPGGLDYEVIKNPLTGQPYVPGSSFKGKLRSQLEIKLNKVNDTNGSPCGCGNPDCIICQMFGAHMNPKSRAGIPRLKFRDMQLTPEFDSLRNITEVKAATMINRSTGTAFNSSLRQVERVAAGVKFEYEIILQIFEGDNEKKMIETLDDGMRLVELTGLGGGTSRGNGKVSFTKSDEVITV